MSENEKGKAGVPAAEEVQGEVVEILSEKGRFTPEETKAIGKLNTRQLLYARMRPLCRTATEAAKRAGYSGKSAQYQSRDLGRNVGIKALIRAYKETSDVTPDDLIELKGDPKEILARNVPKVLAVLWKTIMDPLTKPKDQITACREWLHMAGYKPTEKFEIESRHPELEKLTNSELQERAAEAVADCRAMLPHIVPKKAAG